MFTPKNDRTVALGQRVRLYRNLNNGLFSIKDPRSGLVLGYTDAATLENVGLLVSKAGRLRAIKEGRRNVHAYAEGLLVSFGAAVPGDALRITYNPFKYESFVNRETGEPVRTAGLLYAMGSACFTR